MGTPPPLSLEGEADLQRCSRCCPRGLVHSARDISDGGIAVALAAPKQYRRSRRTGPFAHGASPLRSLRRAATMVSDRGARALRGNRKAGHREHIFAAAIGATAASVWRSPSIATVDLRAHRQTGDSRPDVLDSQRARRRATARNDLTSDLRNRPALRPLFLSSSEVQREDRERKAPGRSQH